MTANLTVSQKVILYFLYEATAGKKDRVANSDKGAWVKFMPASCKIYSNLKQVACLPEALAPVQTWPASVKLRASISADGTYDRSSSWNSDSVSLFQLWLEINAAVLGTAAADCVDFSLFIMFYFLKCPGAQNCIYVAHFVSGGKTHVLHTAYAITEIVAWHHVYNVKLHQYKKTAMI